MRRPRPKRLRRPEARGTTRPGAFARRVALLFLLAACQAGRRGEPEPGADPALLAPARGEFALLKAALNAGDDEQAARLIAALDASELTREERAQLEGARKVLRGRALVADLELALASEELVDVPGRFELVLRARNRNTAAVTLHLAPADLKRQRATIDARGAEGLELDSKLCTVLADLELAPGVESRVVLLSYELPLGRALALRERWRLVTRSGEVRAEGQRYPAAAVTVAGCARERVAPLLVADPAAGSAFAATLRGTARPSARALLEAALAIPSAEREDVLTDLAPLVAELARTDPERIVAAEPALRWLTENRDLGADAGAWAHYLAHRSGSEASDRPRLDLPDRPRVR